MGIFRLWSQKSGDSDLDSDLASHSGPGQACECNPEEENEKKSGSNKMELNEEKRVLRDLFLGKCEG